MKRKKVKGPVTPDMQREQKLRFCVWQVHEQIEGTLMLPEVMSAPECEQLEHVKSLVDIARVEVRQLLKLLFKVRAAGLVPKHRVAREVAVRLLRWLKAVQPGLDKETDFNGRWSSSALRGVLGWLWTTWGIIGSDHTPGCGCSWCADLDEPAVVSARRMVREYLSPAWSG